MKTFFIADTHFGDKNIINYENRPFSNIEEMDQTLIKNWNDVVGINDEVFVLGDYSNYDFDKTKEITNCLNGIKILILGNHDLQDKDYYYKCGFNNVIEYPIVYNNFYLLSHEPLYVNKNMPYANIYGHIHGNPSYTDFSNQSVCVSVERKHINYRPIQLEEINKLIKGEE